MSEKMRDIDALAGERWFPLETSIVEICKRSSQIHKGIYYEKKQKHPT